MMSYALLQHAYCVLLLPYCADNVGIEATPLVCRGLEIWWCPVLFFWHSCLHMHESLTVLYFSDLESDRK